MLSTKNIASQFLQHLGQRNLDALVELFSDEVDWYIPGDHEIAPWLGVRNSKDEVRQFFVQLWAETIPVSAEVEALMTDDNRIIITGAFSTKMMRTGRIVNSLFCIQLTVANGLINKYRLLEDSFAVHMSLL